MTLLLPLAVLLPALVIGAILLLHALRGHSRRVRVPALFLWTDLPPAASGLDRLRRPPFSLLLALQLLAAAALGLALMRPGRLLGHQPRQVALVLDASASMQAGDVANTRFAAARAEALRRLDRLDGSDRVILVRAGTTATLLAEGSPRAVRPALLAARPGSGTAALGDALALAETAIAVKPGRPGSVVVLTDGAFEPLAPVGALAAPVTFVPVAGAGGGNQAIASVAVKAQPSGQGREAYVELINSAAEPVRAPVEVLDAASGQPVAERQVALPARGSAGLVVALPDWLSRLAVRLGAGDSLALDDQAEAGAPGGSPRDVLLVSATPDALRRALEAIPTVRLRVVSPRGFDAAADSTDLTVLDGVLPDRLPPGPLLLVDPPAGNPLLAPAASAAPLTTIDQTSPLLQGVDVAALELDTSPGLAVPAWARAVVSSGQAGLLLDGRLDGRAIVVLAFDPAQDGRDKSLAFPLLISNAVSELLAGEEMAIAPGQPVTLPAPASGRALLIRPDGSREPLSASRSASGSALTITGTDQVGRYRLVDAADPSRVLGGFAVNLLDPVESDIQPRASLAPLAANLTAVHVKPVVAEWWWALAALGLVLLGLEWLVFARRA
ncbi:MAG TPA: VWA domain-containing protein [Thermomicrobiaceae bacterium]|nr:VWA domain-containing protein [Thermomicrobiaceae bacterium]